MPSRLAFTPHDTCHPTKVVLGRSQIETLVICGVAGLFVNFFEKPDAVWAWLHQLDASPDPAKAFAPVQLPRIP